MCSRPISPPPGPRQCPCVVAVFVPRVVTIDSRFTPKKFFSVLIEGSLNCIITVGEVLGLLFLQVLDVISPFLVFLSWVLKSNTYMTVVIRKFSNPRSELLDEIELYHGIHVSPPAVVGRSVVGKDCRPKRTILQKFRTLYIYY